MMARPFDSGYGEEPFKNLRPIRTSPCIHWDSFVWSGDLSFTVAASTGPRASW